MIRALAIALALAGLAPACASARGGAVAWEHAVLWQGPAPIERLRVGRPDAQDPDPQVISVDQAGVVALVRPRDGAARVLHRAEGELTGLVIADADPLVPGEEIYVGGGAPGGSGGAVLQVAVDGERVAVRPVLACDAYVHAIEALPARAGELGARLLLGTYSGELHVLACDRVGAWRDDVVFRDAPQVDPEAPKVKDVAVLDGGTRAFVVFKTGRALDLDLADPAASRFVHVEPGGLSRCIAAARGDVYATGYAGRVLRFTRRDGRWGAEVVAQEGAESGLRGIALGRFPLGDGSAAPLAVFGYHALVRAVSPEHAGATTLYCDEAKGHALATLEIDPENRADELVFAGQSGRISLLFARAR